MGRRSWRVPSALAHTGYHHQLLQDSAVTAAHRYIWTSSPGTHRQILVPVFISLYGSAFAIDKQPLLFVFFLLDLHLYLLLFLR
jgi:hypothetical protein